MHFLMQNCDFEYCDFCLGLRELWVCACLEGYSAFRESYTPSHTFISHREIRVTAGFAGTNDLMVQSPLMVSRLVGKKQNNNKICTLVLHYCHYLTLKTEVISFPDTV